MGYGNENIEKEMRDLRTGNLSPKACLRCPPTIQLVQKKGIISKNPHQNHSKKITFWGPL